MPYKIVNNCVYKKNTNEKVGCTDGSIKEYLSTLSINESDDLDWMRDIVQNKMLTINKLKELFNEKNITVDWDIEYDRNKDSHGDYNEYFGKFYYDTPDSRSHFIELYEKGNGQLFFYLYRFDEEDGEYYKDNVYSQFETKVKDPENFWRQIGWLVLYQMGKINPVRDGETEEETFDIENTVNESDDLDWMRDVDIHPNYNGHPQGVVYLYSHDEIDEFCNVIGKYNGDKDNGRGERRDFHSALEDRRDEIEQDGWDEDEITPMLAVSFFVEMRYPDMLTTGYWNYEATFDDINEWLNDDDTFNRDYTLYGSLKEVIDIFNTLENVSDVNESEGDDLDWIRDTKPFIPLTKSNLYVGMEVRIINNTRYDYDDDKGNPRDTIGKIVTLNNKNVGDHLTSNLYIIVDWDGDNHNSYHHTDLESQTIPKKITEQAGISTEARGWSEVVYDTIMSNPQERTRLIIDCYDYPDEQHGFPIDYIVIDYYDKLTGYGQEHSGYDKDGNYVVLLYIQPGLVDGKANYGLKTTLTHEFKHAFQDYKRRSTGHPSIDETKESKELYNKDFIQLLSNNTIHGPIKDILKYHYYLSKLEREAYIENVYDGNLEYERLIRNIISKDFNSFKDRFDLDVNWHLITTAYDIPLLKKFKSPREFIDYSSEKLIPEAQKMLKKINKMKYVHGLH